MTYSFINSIFYFTTHSNILYRNLSIIITKSFTLISFSHLKENDYDQFIFSELYFKTCKSDNTCTQLRWCHHSHRQQVTALVLINYCNTSRIFCSDPVLALYEGN